MPSSGPALPRFALAVVLLGIGDAMANSYLVLFAADEADLSPLQVGLLATASGLGGIVISTWLGRRFDRRPTRAYIVAVLLLGAVGFILLSFVRAFVVLFVLFFTLLGAPPRRHSRSCSRWPASCWAMAPPGAAPPLCCARAGPWRGQWARCWGPRCWPGVATAGCSWRPQ